MDSPSRRMMLCWGKTGSTAEEYHPVVLHMLDVGHVARELLSSDASPRWRHVLANVFGTDEVSLVDWLPWLVALHDIGKISAAFQQQNVAQRDRLAREGFSFGNRRWNGSPYHSEVGQAFLTEEIPGPVIPNGLEMAWVDMLGGHHGRFAPPDTPRKTRRLLKAYEPEEWAGLRKEADGILRSCLLRASADSLPTPENVSSASMALTGFTILCDWLGSDSGYFVPSPGAAPEDYLPRCASGARMAVEAAGFLAASLSQAPPCFGALFPKFRPARPLQAAVDEIPGECLAEPCLAIIEAPTGEGKTEAALTLAHRLAQASGSDELYYALPTAATSNQMLLRLESHLREGLALQSRAKLIHGQAFLKKDDLRVTPLGNGDERESPPALEWFGPKKRALLAPFGVGTIDQAELAALNVPHSALRMIGLAGKVLILDEVHAYDVYMTSIIERLLQWLSALGTSVILLSATLPTERRSRLARAYGARAGENGDASYPLLLVLNRDGLVYTAQPAPSQPGRTIAIQPLHFGESDADAKARWLMNAVAQGGCGVWITNTVERAQKLFQALESLRPAKPLAVELLLLHGRFPLDEREARERQLSEKYGPRQERRPTRGIVVGTQVLEQSLDLDFDIMVSDLAPVDLLLQRGGRLHRHSRERPESHAIPRLFINTDMGADGDLRLGTDRWIYAEFILRQSWLMLEHKHQLNLPADYRALVEAVYAAPEPPPGSPLRDAWQELRNSESDAVGMAQLRLLPPPNPSDSFAGPASGLVFEEDEDRAAWAVARTRLGEESLTVIPLERQGARARTVVDGEAVEVEIDSPAPRETQLRLLRRSLRLSHRQAVRVIGREGGAPRLFTESALLKRCHPLWLRDGRTTLGRGDSAVTLTLDARLGLVIQRENGG